MIPISQIDPELSIYKENTVVIWGAGKFGREILSLLQKFSVKVSYFCDSNPKLWKTEIEGVPVILPQELMKMHLEQSQEKGEVLVQIAMLPQYEAQVRPQVEALGIFKIICYQEAWQMLQFFQRCSNVEENPTLLDLFQNQSFAYLSAMNIIEIRRYLLMNQTHSSIFICTIPKTGDVTMLKTFQNLQIPHKQTNLPFLLHRKYMKKRIRIVVGVRDPIARDISHVYELLSTIGDREQFTKKNVDAQVYCNEFHFQNKQIQSAKWYGEFTENIVDIRKYPFNQEKGYTIIKEGNYDIFFYQLEKLNDLVPELSEWVGVPFTELVMGNEASSKWIADSYRQAQKELKFSQEYFDACYDDPYVQHCYSQEDIEKFKDRWRGNIDPNK